jgi:hypothetical protein
MTMGHGLKDCVDRWKNWIYGRAQQWVTSMCKNISDGIYNGEDFGRIDKTFSSW